MDKRINAKAWDFSKYKAKYKILWDEIQQLQNQSGAAPEAKLFPVSGVYKKNSLTEHSKKKNNFSESESQELRLSNATHGF